MIQIDELRYCPKVLIALLLYFRFSGRMGEEDKFCLKWNDFQDNIARAHRDLRTDRFAGDGQYFSKTDSRDFHDVSLVCGGETFKAHRVILAACSTAFREMIRSGFVINCNFSLTDL